jgi:hypothetical protein
VEINTPPQTNTPPQIITPPQTNTPAQVNTPAQINSTCFAEYHDNMGKVYRFMPPYQLKVTNKVGIPIAARDCS